MANLSDHRNAALNYRHAFHAGSFADVVKHALLVRLALYLQRKDKPFRVFDTHAGIGLYDLAGDEAVRGGEHREGIERLLASPAADTPLLADYVGLVRQIRSDHGASAYPGSPLLLRRLLRRQDRLSAYELHPRDAETLASLFRGDIQVKTFHLDGWLALGAHLPPKERRGLVLIDPPFEQADEIERAVAGLAKAYRRWPGGTYALWYPIKRRTERERLHALLRETGIANILAAEFQREPFGDEIRMTGSGLVVVNPPYTFSQEAGEIIQVLGSVLGRTSAADGRIVAIAAEQP
ncbi:23S rRNA (adenine(2030)-N(6))-methyltransferase RlmJ [Consotaella aegiceratis]|uniref:23S rRNA (adenine(2030)-N(6))-methyltransferase RlmJ n=1 Tax=Consotaella aegiceratis TaxID=3097961 RepID=UPI002F3FB8B9